VNARVSDRDFDLQEAVSEHRLTGLWRMMRGYRLAYLGATASLAIAALARTSTFLLLQQLIDNVLGQVDKLPVLPLFALGFVVLAMIEGSLSFLSGRLAAYTAESVTLRLRKYLYDHIQRMTFTYHDLTSTGELIERSTSDVEAMRRFYADQAIGVGRIILVFVINFAALLRLNVQLALVSVVIVPLIVGVSAYFFRLISKAYEKYQEQEAKLSTTLQENLTGVRVVKAFARQGYEQDKFERDNLEKYQRGKRLARLNAFFWPLSDTMCGLQTLIGWTVGANMALNGTITIGTYLAYVGLVGWIIWPMRNLGRLIVNMSTGLVSYSRVTKMLQVEREPLEEGAYRPTGNLHGEVSFREVGFEYNADTPVLKDVSFECRPGQAIALLGSTGSGKTTLVNLLPRFYEYSSGHILVDGVELRHYPRHYLRRQIGMVEQEAFLFSRSIRENITYGVGREVSQEEVEDAARAAAVHDVIVSFPNGYNTLVGERGVTLSGGQKQRVAIARTLLKDPRILILDDSTSSVDMETEAEIRSALELLMRGRTTFIIAHRIQSLMAADLILVMDKGHIIQRGTHAELMEQPGMYCQIYELQARMETELEKELAEV
jgi:ATP-binding cassette, subfamily B, bacterial